MSKKTQLEAMQMAQAYAIEYPETADLIAMFLKMRKHPKASIKISVGKTESENEFVSYLISNLRFPKIKFSIWENEPLILIQNHFESIASLNIAGCKILRSEKVKFDAPLNMKKEVFLVRTADGLDYQITATFENRIDGTPSETE